MNRTGPHFTAWLGAAVLTLSGCAGTDLVDYEADEAAACFIDHGAWAGEIRTTRYVEAVMRDLHDHFPDFLDGVERAALAAADTPPESWPTMFEPLHDEAGANIVRVGRLLPRLNRPLDIPPMIEQVGSGQVWSPRSDSRTEFLRVALAEEFVDHQSLGEHLSGFLTALQRVEGLLLTLKTQGTEADRRRLVTAIADLKEGWEGALPGMTRVIFDRPHMPVDESLAERLEVRVRAICEAHNTCDREGGGCGPASESDGLTGPPMDDGT